MAVHGLLPLDDSDGPSPSAEHLLDVLAHFTWQGRPTTQTCLSAGAAPAGVPVFTNEFWTSKQRAASANSLHEISYRACFKPQLPAFFIERLSREAGVVYDPFAGRGTTLIEAALRERTPAGCDINPLSGMLVRPRLAPPTLRELTHRLHALDLTWNDSLPEDLLTFYHPVTLAELCALRAYLIDRQASGEQDHVDEWIRMVAVNRLTGHSPGFLSVYTLPPNQAVSVDSQRKINRDRNQQPARRDLRHILVRKSASLLKDVDDIARQRLGPSVQSSRFHVGSCTETFWEDESVSLIVTSPPFLDVVDYAADNWLRCWFCGITSSDVRVELFRKVDEWRQFIERGFRQFQRLLEPDGFIAFEVGEVRGGALKLEEIVLPAGIDAGLLPVCVVVNEQTFTKTANIWGVSNNAKGTNTNRVVVFQKAKRASAGSEVG